MPRANILQMLRRSVGVMSTHLGYLLEESSLLRSVWSDLLAFRARHDIRPLIGGRFELEQMADAHALVESRRSVGKVVVSVR